MTTKAKKTRQNSSAKSDSIKKAARKSTRKATSRKAAPREAAAPRKAAPQSGPKPESTNRKDAKDQKTSRLAVKPTVEVADVNPFASRRGRTPKLVLNDETVQRIQALSALNLTQNEAAGALLVAPSTFKKFLAEHDEAKEAWEIGENAGKASVKRAQFVMAHRSATMAIWWGKQHLGQSDKVEEKVDATLLGHVTQGERPAIADQAKSRVHALEMFEAFRRGLVIEHQQEK